VIRLKSPLKASWIERLKAGFDDALMPFGDMILSGPLEAEADEPDLAHLPRLVVDFNRRNFARLRSLIDAINAY
jgi:hypothetical protein